MCIGGIIMALREDLNLSWLVWVSVPVLILVVGYLVVWLMPLFRAMQKKIDRINAVLREQIIGIRVVRAFVREPYETDRFGVANKDLTDVSLKIGALFVLMFPAIGMILHLSTAAVLWFGGQRVDSGEMQVGALTAFRQYLLQILMAVMMGTFMAMMIPRASVCADRTGVVLDVNLHPPTRTAETPTTLAGVVEYRNVTFAYPGAESPGTKQHQLHCQAGETVGRIIGSTGPGKTSLLSLLPRLYDIAEGEVLLDGVSVCQPGPGRDHQTRCPGPAASFLFSGTIEHNLRFGKTEATDQELWDALQVAQGEDFVAQEEERLERPDLTGRHQRLRRPAATALHRPRPGHQAQGVPL